MSQEAIKRYTELQIAGMGSLDVVIAILDFCVSAASARDISKTVEGLTTLQQSLSFRDCPELARLFSRVYEHCRRLVVEDRFEEAQNCLRLLRGAWSEARQQRRPIS